MSAARALRLVATAGLLVVALPGRATAQGEAGRWITAARAQLDEANFDSAAVLLGTALAPAQGANRTERTRAWTLFAIVQLVRENLPGARDAIRQALAGDMLVRVDSLSFFHDALVREFESERAALAPPAPAPPAPPVPVSAPARVALTVVPELALDTSFGVDSGRLRVTATLSYPARVVLTVSPVDAPTQLLWGDTTLGVEIHTAWWNLRGRDGALVAPGRYALRSSASDTANQVSPTIERILVVSRVPVDTQPSPPPLLPSAFAPETLRLRNSPAVLLTAVSLGAAAAVLPSALGDARLNAGRPADATAYVVAGTVSVAGLVGFLRGHRMVYSPENAQRNAELHQADAARRAGIARANAQALADAPLRVQVEP